MPLVEEAVDAAEVLGRVEDVRVDLRLIGDVGDGGEDVGVGSDLEDGGLGGLEALGGDVHEGERGALGRETDGGGATEAEPPPVMRTTRSVNRLVDMRAS